MNKNNHSQAIRREFEPVGPTLLKNLLGAGWGLPLTLRWADSWLPTYLAIVVFFFRQVKSRFHNGIWKWVPLHSHPAV